MRKLLKTGGRSAICAAALTLSPLSPNFNYAEASNHTDNCAVEAGRIVMDTEVCVEEPIPVELGHNVMEDYRVWLVGGAVLTAVGIGLGAGLMKAYERVGLPSDHDPEAQAHWLARDQRDAIEKERLTKERLDKIQDWLNARGETPMSRYILSTAGRGVKAVWVWHRDARKEAKEARREDKLARTKSGINRKGGMLGENIRS